jgi:hypothetical protein
MNRTEHPLDALVGHWNTTGENIPAGAEVAISVRGMDKYEWLPGRKFLVHQADVWMGDEKVNVIEIMGPCGDDLTAIPMHSFDNNGSHLLMVAKQESSTAWVFSHSDLRTRLVIHEGGAAMTARWERKVDGRWAHWLNMRFEKTT